MSERSDLISRLLRERDFRASYLRGKLNVLVSAQIYALRKKIFGTQKALADAVDMKQSRISAMEQPGSTKFNLETLIRLAATFKVGLIVKFVPYSELLREDNKFVQDEFDVTPVDKDVEFLTPTDDAELLMPVIDEKTLEAISKITNADIPRFQADWPSNYQRLPNKDDLSTLTVPSTAKITVNIREVSREIPREKITEIPTRKFAFV